MRLLAPLTALLLTTPTLHSSAQAAPLRLEFWHAMTGVQDTVNGYAQAFNKAQSAYEIVPVSQGNYRELQPKLEAAIRAGTPPALAQVEFTQFPALAAGGQLLDLTSAVAALPGGLTGDFYPAVWKSGQFGGRQYGLPWNVSVPVLMYNAGALKKAGVKAPGSWAELEAAAARLAGGSKRPLVAVADAWTFEANVLSRGGALVDGTKPALNSPDAVEALTQLARMSAAKTAQPRTLNDATRAAFDFARGQNVFALASVANWIDARKLPFFDLGIAPFPCEKPGACSVPLGGATLSVPRGNSAAAQAGALAFWQFLNEPARLANWVQVTAYAPPRKAVTPLLEGWYTKNPQLRAAHAQLNRAVPRPAVPAYEGWTRLLEDAINRATTGKQSARAALDEAQRQALK
ncbi:ABC transporter substrate-binding protein [Deinococcus radiopugnans]|uniref:Sn-glycerol 3-phosphate transport system substrate-binding protein n=2 Tax=Deinococcus radiopugnans ATCC 19172 TaxID=585398 RepID=A0ABR6NTB6_9DEIO|nr:ABC transporter substrate-binding protein [Deinococcus radiopugnans]MBB6017293.1 sn-glycerol 3-phosphate transport system substrate-binding protein [Deinococcus radiopugnans ATCC 19172]